MTETTTHPSRGFGSDNHSAVHPDLLDAFLKCLEGHAPSYDTDSWSLELRILVKTIFGNSCEAFAVLNGSGANVCALRVLTKPWQSVLCSDVSHIFNDEAGAPENCGGFKLIPLVSRNGKIQLEQIKKSLIRRGDQHTSQVKTVSLTQPTEKGTCYTIRELKEIGDFCKEQNLNLHIDGARLANAAHFLQTELKSITQYIGAKAVSFGGAKNGFINGELVLLFDSSLNEDFKYIRKQSLQLPSKSRFISSAFIEYLKPNEKKLELWKNIAAHTHSLAKQLETLLLKIPEITISQAVESNAVFVVFPKHWIKVLKKKFFFYVWNEETFECRIMMSWDNTTKDLEEFYNQILKLKNPLAFPSNMPKS